MSVQNNVPFNPEFISYQVLQVSHDGRDCPRRAESDADFAAELLHASSEQTVEPLNVSVAKLAKPDPEENILLGESTTEAGPPPTPSDSVQNNLLDESTTTAVPPPAPSSFQVSDSMKTERRELLLSAKLRVLSKRLNASRLPVSRTQCPGKYEPCTLYQKVMTKQVDAYADKARSNDADPTRGAVKNSKVIGTSLDPHTLNKSRQWDNEEELCKKYKRRHCHFWFPHGKFWTSGIILLSVTSLVLSIYTIKSTEFARLRIPLPESADFISVDSVGLVKMKLCSNMTVATAQNLKADKDLCQTIILSTEQDNDRLWIVARSVACLAVAMGFFLTTVVASSVCWESINFKPIAIAYFVVYLLQSLTLFFFASDLCRTQKCSFGPGATFSVLATLLWILIFFACIRMDVSYNRKIRQQRESLEPRKDANAKNWQEAGVMEDVKLDDLPA